MSEDHALGIDIGTSGVRVALLAPDGTVAGQCAARMSDHGDNLRSPHVWKTALTAVMERFRDDHGMGKIGAVAIDGTSGTVLALDENDVPVGDALMYDDAVEDAAIPAAISRIAPRESAAHGAASALARAIALQKRPGVVRIVHQADWFAAQLAGTPVPTDESNALKTGYDPIARQWPGWLANSPLRPGLLPKVLPCGARSGSLSGAYGLPESAALVTGATDGCTSFLATGAADPGDAVSALGTTLTLKLLSDRPIFAPQYGVYSHRIGNIWLAGGASNTGGGVLAAHFGPDDLTRLSENIDLKTSTGLDYYPLLKAGERFPVSDPALPPRLTPRPASDTLFLQAMLEGMARIEAEGYRRLVGLGAPELRTLRTVGGGAGNSAWRVLRQAALGISETPALSEEAAVGAARLALAWLQQ